MYIFGLEINMSSFLPPSVEAELVYFQGLRIGSGRTDPSVHLVKKMKKTENLFAVPCVTLSS